MSEPDLLRRATIADVARIAGVSTSTASLAFRDGGPISDAMRARILGTARDLGYAGPNLIARYLKSGRMGIVGVVVAEQVVHAFDSPVTTMTMSGLSEILEGMRYSLLLLPGGQGGNERVVQKIGDVPLDAIVLLSRGERFDDVVEAARARRVPVVGVESPPMERISRVEIADQEGVFELTSLVASFGHRRVGVLLRSTRLGYTGKPEGPESGAGRVGSIENATIRRRLQAVLDRFPDAVVVEAASRDVAAGEAAARRLLQDSPDVTVIMAQNDLLAAGAIRAADAAGLRVPEDISVTGFDGVALPWLTRQITTVRQPLEERGRVAGRLAGRLMSDPDDIETVTLGTEVVAGSTLGAPR